MKPPELSLSPSAASTSAGSQLGSGVTATGSVSNSLFTPPVLNNLTGETPSANDTILSWTPARGQFLLGNRREELSLTVDSGNFAEFPVDQPVAESSTTAKLIAASPSTTTVIAAAQLPPAPPRQDRQPAVTKPEPVQPAAPPVTVPEPDEPLLMAEADVIDEVPSDEELAVTAEETSLMDYFTREELAGEYTGSFVADADLPPAGESERLELPGNVGVIQTAGQPETASVKPTLGETLAGTADSELGSGVPQFSPWRSIAVVLGLLSLVFVGLWLAKRGGNPLRALKDKSLTVIETINLGAQRQIVIVEMNEDALVLGVTSHSINLLTRVPMYELQTGYQGVVNKIIQNEAQTSEEHWQQRPAFQTAAMATELAPAMATGTYGPAGQGKQRIGEVRRIRQAIRPGSIDIRTNAAYPRTEQTAKAELIRRAREQLQALEN